MYQCFFGKPFPEEYSTRLPDEKLTAAEVSQVLFKNFKNPHPDVIIDDLLNYHMNRKTFSVKYKPNEPVWEPQEELSGGYA
jgi:hypothetical protein